jgi:hypothetical protein
MKGMFKIQWLGSFLGFSVLLNGNHVHNTMDWTFLVMLCFVANTGLIDCSWISLLIKSTIIWYSLEMLSEQICLNNDPRI